MENKNNKGIERTRKVIFVLFIVFLCLYSVSLNGYTGRYETSKVLYTEEKIKEFEKDVENGKEININNYISYNDIDYSNRFSEMGERASYYISYAVNKTVSAIIDFFSVFFK